MNGDGGHHPAHSPGARSGGGTPGIGVGITAQHTLQRPGQEEGPGSKFSCESVTLCPRVGSSFSDSRLFTAQSAGLSTFMEAERPACCQVSGETAGWLFATTWGGGPHGEGSRGLIPPRARVTDPQKCSPWPEGCTGQPLAALIQFS